jgi:hypothetical protein
VEAHSDDSKFDLIVINAALHVWYVATDRNGLERREAVDPSLRITNRFGNSCCILERYDPARMVRRSRAYSLDALAKPSRQLRGARQVSVDGRQGLTDADVPSVASPKPSPQLLPSRVRQ